MRIGPANAHKYIKHSTNLLLIPDRKRCCAGEQVRVFPRFAPSPLKFSPKHANKDSGWNKCAFHKHRWYFDPWKSILPQRSFDSQNRSLWWFCARRPFQEAPWGIERIKWKLSRRTSTSTEVLRAFLASEVLRKLGVFSLDADECREILWKYNAGLLKAVEFKLKIVRHPSLLTQLSLNI